MRIMNAVWPLTALYAPGVALWAYFRTGRPSAGDDARMSTREGAESKVRDAPAWREIAVSASHCGAGCMLADIIGASIVFAAGWALLGEALYAEYVVTLGLAWLFGVAFQYFSIQPMKHLSPARALAEAARADTLSILFFQIGMYGWMAIVYFILFPHPHLKPDSAVFWFMEQIGMLLGFVTACPVNWWLLQSGLKEAMN